MERAPAETEAAETSGLAIASLFVSILWLFGLGSIAAIVLGMRALREIDGSGGEVGGRGLAIAGIAVAVAGLLSAALLVAFLVASAQH